MTTQTKKQRKLKYTDPHGWVEHEFSPEKDVVTGTISDAGLFTGTVNLNRLSADLFEYLGAKFSVDAKEAEV